MDITGKIISVLPLQTGTGKSSEWKKQTAVLETSGDYPKKVAFDCFGDKIKPLKIGDTVTVSFDIESREFNGKWYTNVNAWKVEGGSDKAEPEKHASAPQTNEDTGLPF
jgi:hypothetical protein